MRGVLDEVQQDIPGSSAAAPPLEGSRDEFSIDDVVDPTLELFLDPLLHPDKVICMVEFGRRFYEYSKVSVNAVCIVVAVDISLLTLELYAE